MPTSRNSPNEDEQHPEVRERLGALRKIRAPWYFDAMLQRRLQPYRSSGGRRRPVSLKTVGIGVSAIIVIVCGISYTYLSRNSGDDGQFREERGVPAEHPPGGTDAASPEGRKPPADAPEERGNVEARSPHRSAQAPVGTVPTRSRARAGQGNAVLTRIGEHTDSAVAGGQPGPDRSGTAVDSAVVPR